MIDPEELRKLTEIAIHKGEEERRQEEEEARKRAARKRAEQDTKIERVLAEIPEKARKAAREKKNQVAVYRIEFGEIDTRLTYEARPDPLPRTAMEYVPGRLYDELEKAGLKPRAIYDHDGVGVSSWYVLTIFW